MFKLSAVFGKIVLKLLRVTGKGGSALPGLVVEKIYPRFLIKFGQSLPSRGILVTGTNGKTTTTKIISSIYEQAGYRVLTNKTGSNFNRGIISAIIDHMTWFGSLPYDIAILEVDEAYSPTIAESILPSSICVLNVFRDQLDRFGELDSTVARIAKAAHHSESVILNADDPSLKTVATEAKKVIYFGAADYLSDRLPSDPHMKTQVSSKQKLDYVLELTEEIKNEQHINISSVANKYDFKTLLNGIHNAINITAAVALCESIGEIKQEIIHDTLSRVRPAFGRGESFTLGDLNVNLLLVKNPAGFNQTIRSLSDSKTDYLVLAINDKTADGRDVSWLWDAEINLLSKLNSKQVIASGSRADDMAVRLKYENIKSKIIKSPKNLVKDFKSSNHKNVVIIATYTAMLQIREELSGHIDMKEFWR